jgi:hypothetical protein
VLRGWIQQSVIDLVITKLQPASGTMNNELRIVIGPGQTLARGVINQHSVLSEDAEEVEWDDEETTIRVIDPGLP